VVSSTPWPHFTPRKIPVPIVQEGGWAPRPVWTDGNSRPHLDSISDRPARSQSLYRLSYPAHTFDPGERQTVRTTSQAHPASYSTTKGQGLKVNTDSCLNRHYERLEQYLHFSIRLHDVCKATLLLNCIDCKCK